MAIYTKGTYAGVGDLSGALVESDEKHKTDKDMVKSDIGRMDFDSKFILAFMVGTEYDENNKIAS